MQIVPRSFRHSFRFVSFSRREERRGEDERVGRGASSGNFESDGIDVEEDRETDSLHNGKRCSWS